MDSTSADGMENPPPSRYVITASTHVCAWASTHGVSASHRVARADGPVKTVLKGLSPWVTAAEQGVASRSQDVASRSQWCSSDAPSPFLTQRRRKGHCFTPKWRQAFLNEVLHTPHFRAASFNGIPKRPLSVSHWISITSPSAQVAGRVLTTYTSGLATRVCATATLSGCRKRPIPSVDRSDRGDASRNVRHSFAACCCVPVV